MAFILKNGNSFDCWKLLDFQNLLKRTLLFDQKWRLLAFQKEMCCNVVSETKYSYSAVSSCYYSFRHLWCSMFWYVMAINIIIISLTNAMNPLSNHTNIIFYHVYFSYESSSVERRQQLNVLQMPLLIIGLSWFTFHPP